jgi:hypothetical protein
LQFDPAGREANRGKDRLTSPYSIDDDLDDDAPEPHDEQEFVMRLLHHWLLCRVPAGEWPAFAF